MPKRPTFPMLYEDCKRLSASKLKSWNYLNPNHITSGVVKWSKNGYEVGSISVRVQAYEDFAYLNLSYKYNGDSIAYQVRLTPIPSNLGKGVVWYFVCPKTGKLCRNLYLIAGYFYHRTAFTGVYYQWQVFSRKTRELCKGYELDFIIDRAYVQLYSKYFKSHYNGKPTKRFLKLKKQITATERIAQVELY